MCITDFHCNCQIKPNGFISHEPNKIFLANIKQEEGFLFMELNSLILNFYLVELGRSKTSGRRKFLITIKNWNTTLSIQAGTTGVSVVSKPSTKNGQCQQMATLFSRLILPFWHQAPTSGLPRMVGMSCFNCWQGLPNDFTAQLTVGSWLRRTCSSQLQQDCFPQSHETVHL